MKSMWRLLFVMMSASLLLWGCGGGSDSGTGPDTDGGGTDNGTTTTLTTSLALAGEPVAAASLRAAAVQAATVTLTLPDGTTYTMADNGSGSYSCTVKNFPTGSPFVIDAHAGDLVLKNFFEGLQNAEGEIDLGETNPKTTLFVDLLATFVGALDANLNFPTAQNLLQAVQKATLAVDVVTLKDQVNDDNDPVFEQVRQTYQTVLSWGNLTGGTSSETLIADAGTLTTVVNEITTGGVLPPVGGSDVDAIRPLLAQLYLAYLKGDTTTLAAGLGSDGFLWSGQNAADFLAGMQTDEEFGALAGINVTVANTSGIVEPGPETNSWWLYGSGEFSYSMDGLPRRFAFDDKKNAFEGNPLLVKKDAQGRLAVYGDQKKTETWGDIEYVQQKNHRDCNQGPTACTIVQNSSTWIGFGAGMSETTRFPVSSATLSGTAFPQSFEMKHHPWNDADERQFWGQYKTNGTLTSSVGVYDEATSQWVSNPITWTVPLEGSKLKAAVIFADATTETRTFVVPAAVTPVYPTITGVSGNADGTATVNWTDISGSMPGGAGLAEIEVEIIDDRNGSWYRVMELWDLLPGTSSVTVPAGQLVPGEIYLARVEYEDLYGRSFESRSYFVAPTPPATPTPTLSITDALLNGKSFTNAWDDSDTGGHTEETITFSGTGGQYSVTVRDQTYNAAGALIDDTTDTITGGIQSDGTFRVDFPGPDPESGATYAILTLLAVNTDSVTIRFTEFNAADAQVYTDTETWQTL